MDKQRENGIIKNRNQIQKKKGERNMNKHLESLGALERERERERYISLSE